MGACVRQPLLHETDSHADLGCRSRAPQQLSEAELVGPPGETHTASGAPARDNDPFAGQLSEKATEELGGDPPPRGDFCRREGPWKRLRELKKRVQAVGVTSIHEK